MFCKDCEYGMSLTAVNDRVSTIRCDKYGIAVDTTHPFERVCIDDECDVIWRAGLESACIPYSGTHVGRK